MGSFFLAKVWGIFLIIIALTFFINKKNIYLIFKAYENKWNRFLFGIVSLIIGILMILSHNIGFVIGLESNYYSFWVVSINERDNLSILA